MVQIILPVLGGIGIFLVGIVALTEGLRTLAGDAVRRFIRGATRSPLSGAATGAATTALLQSSSATTVAVVGFVGAGLMSFPQALGVIFGANIGSTATGWLVTLIGFKLQLGEIALPLVFAGIVLRLFGRGRLQSVGWAIAGFGLMFVGIATLQAAMSGLRDGFDPASLPDDTLAGRLLLVLIGIAVTLVTQASSAGVALSLAAIGAGAIDFTQAAALVIGMDIGTTFTAVLATAGGSVAVRRTGFAHLVYNLLTGAMAFFLLLPLVGWADRTIAGGLVRDPQISLVAFHTAFNVLGVLAILPFTRQFAGLMQRLIPERGPPMTARLDERLLAEPAAACDALAATVSDIARALFAIVAARLAGGRARDAEADLAANGEATEETRRFADAIQFEPGAPMSGRHAAAIHVLDHLARLAARCRQRERLDLLSRDERLQPLAGELSAALIGLSGTDGFVPAAKPLDRLHRKFRRARQRFRAATIGLASTGEVEVDHALKLLDAARWLDRVSYHLWRILLHLETLRPDGAERARPSPAREAQQDVEED
jgi:phosphate:Na+ symporter